jgi:hypothetical protein
MKAMTPIEAREWCSQGSTGLHVTRDEILRYKRSEEHKFFITAPEEHRMIAFLARTLPCFRGEANFSGGFLWLRRWDIGSRPEVSSGWLILESVRRAHGELRSLEVADAQYFREDEFAELHVFLIQTIAYGWVADYVPCAGGYFLHFKDNRQICFTAESAGTLKELRTAYQRWNPTDEDPMVVKMALIRKERRRSGSGYK